MKSKVYEYWKDKVAWSNQSYPCMSKVSFFDIIKQAKQEFIDELETRYKKLNGFDIFSGEYESIKERHLSTFKKKAT